jgi:hypothetical protein
LFGIFLKPESKQKYLLVEQMQLSFIFAICQFKYLFCNIKYKISAISWRPVLVVEEAGVPGENNRWANNW